ncbi:MAG: hypothetical protein IJS53_00510 [Clostridia bacterium]|nr:hypothetical protein [Clostridia bacterium]
MKRMMILLLAALLACVSVLSFAEAPEAPYVPAKPNAEALAEDYQGEWLCAWAQLRDEVFEAESDLEVLGMTEALTLTIGDGFAVALGIPELEGDPLPMTFEEGALVFQPVPEVRVFTLQLLEDGVMSLTFNMVEGAPVLYLVHVEEEAPEA